MAAAIDQPCTCEDGDCVCRSDPRADAAIHAQLALAASNAISALAVLISRQP